MKLRYDPSSLADELLNRNPLLVDKLLNNNVVSSAKEANDGLVELLKFLYLCANSDAVLTPSLRVDTLWHEFILFSRSYTQFCQMHFSQYIHHQPSDSPNNEMHQYQHTVQCYRLHFGMPNTDFWATSGICHNHCGSCENNK